MTLDTCPDPAMAVPPSMDWLSLRALSVALAMDAFAVSIVTGLTLDPMTRRHVFRLAFHFGLFQALMPVLGWIAGSAVQPYIAAFDHWIVGTAWGKLVEVVGRLMLLGIGIKILVEHLST